jgi:hypothetical protein
MADQTDLPRPAQQRLAALFRRLSVRDNPFGQREADHEGLQEQAPYFFPHPLFQDILGEAATPESVLVLAERGAGKTTIRQEIERRCRAGRAPVAGVLDVRYTDFSRPLDAAQAAGRRVNLGDHITEIVRLAVLRLLEGFDEVRLARYAAISRAALATLAGYVRAYSHLLDADDAGKTVDELLHRYAAGLHLTFAVDTSELLGSEGPAIRAALPEALQPPADFLLRLRDQRPRALATGTPLTLLEEFLTLLPLLGYQAMYVLVDRVDEGDTRLKKSATRLVAFLEPLLTNLLVLEQPRLAFKFFLPSYLERPLDTIDLRRKRLLVYHLTWSEDDLFALLERRLLSFSRFRSLQNFCEPPLASRQAPQLVPGHPNVRYVDWALVRAAGRLPRNLIRRCRILFETYANRVGSEQITEADLEKALAADLGTDGPPAAALGSATPAAPPLTLSLAETPPEPESERASAIDPPQEESIPPRGLFIDAYGYVYRDGEKLESELTPKQRALLAYLIAHRHRLCHKDDVLRAIWGEPYGPKGERLYSHSILPQTVRRLRLAVERDPAHPRFILTIEGVGLRLEDE